MRAAALSTLAAGCFLALAAAAAPAPPPAVDARAFVVEDGRGEILAGRNDRSPEAIASITKLMTVLVALEHHALSDVVAVDPRAAAVGQESIELEPGERLSVADLVRGALIQSANDAAVALALSVSPDVRSFAALMNAKAAQLGLRDTHFVNPDGLDEPGAYSTADDVTTLARAAMRVPFIRETVAEQTAAIGGGRTLHTWNDLLGVVPGVVGVKTGHTGAAGWCEVLADRVGATTLYVTVLGSPSRAVRNAALERLLSWAIGEIGTVEAVAAGRVYARVALPYGRGSVGLAAPAGLRAFVGPRTPVVERVVAARSVALPVRRGQVLGRIEVWTQGRLVGRRPLVATRSVPAPSDLGRLEWYAGRTVRDIEELFS
jgi:D-alanyl-D-alanine carboxypeptidase (penicillin-binding protein 5/6)